jgi:hypothetical protein
MEYLNDKATGMMWPTGKEWATRKIRVRKDDSLLLFMQAHNIAWEHLYEVVEED